MPLGGSDYWIGATVEFPATDAPPSTPLLADPARLEALHQRAIAYCQALKQATILEQWTGLRPRPEGRPAPAMDRVSGYGNVAIASGN